MAMAVMVTSIVVVVVLVKVLVWAIAAIDRVVVVEVSVIDVWADVVIDTLSGVEIIVVAAVVIPLKKVAVSIRFFVDAPSNMVVDTLKDALDNVIMGFIGVEVLADANGNVFAFLMTALEFAVPES